MPEIGDTEAFVDWSACTPAQNAVNVDPDITTLHIPGVVMRAWSDLGIGVEAWYTSSSDVINSVDVISISAKPFKAGLSAEATIDPGPPFQARFNVTITNSGSFATVTTYELEISAAVNWYSGILHQSFDEIYTFKQYLGSQPSVGTSKWEFTTGGCFSLTAYNQIKRLVAARSNRVWYERKEAAGEMVELTAARGDIDTSNQLAMFEAWQRAFIINGEKLKIADLGTTKLSHSALSKPHAKGDLLTQDQGNDNYAYMVVDYTNPDKTETYGYAFYEGEAEAFDTSHSVSGSGEGSSFRPTAVTNPPHWYDYTAAKGELPPKAYLGCLYNGRVVLAGNPADPTQFYMSRQGDAFDYQYTSNDPGTPVKGGQGDMGRLGDIIRALVPYKDEYLIFGCASTMWVLFGDPAAGGTIRELSLTTGIFGPGAFCWDDTNHFYWWGNGGLYRTAVPGTPVCISQIKLPQLVKDEAASPMTHRILMAYDRDRHGILVTITKLDDGSNSNYWYDLAVLDDHGVGGFYPEVYPKECSAYSLLYYDSDTPSLRGLLVGGTDGHIRTFDDAAKNDSTGGANHAIESYVCVGPIHMSGSARHEGMLNGLDITCAGGLPGGSQADSGGITFKVFTSRTAENVLEQMSANGNPAFAGVFKGPGARRGSTRRQTARGEFLGIRLQNTALDETWAFEDMSVNLKASGRVK